MKASLVIALTLTCLSVSLPSLAEIQRNWIHITTNNLGDRVMLDLNSIRVRNQRRIRQVDFTTTTYYSSPDPDGVAGTLTSFTADCLTDSLGVSRFTTYDSNNQIVDDFKRWTGFQSVQSGSVGGRLYEYSCQHLR